MIRVGIIGAGSIGNHLAFSARKKGWDVTVTDNSSDSMERFREVIYPQRYGEFDQGIELLSLEDFWAKKYEIIFIGTPPDSHFDLFLKALALKPKIIVIEKPISHPSLEVLREFDKHIKNSNIPVLCGYNHRVGLNTKLALELARTNSIGLPKLLTSKVLESWDGILKAHPWLNGPEESYLGYTQRGGGATFEHSHGIDLWMYYAHELHVGEITRISAKGKFVVTDDGLDYDEMIHIDIETTSGCQGIVAQDVITDPSQKYVEIHAENGYIKSIVGDTKVSDRVLWKSTADDKISADVLINKTRYFDFDNEIDEIERLYKLGATKNVSSALHAEMAIKSAFVGCAALEAARLGVTLSLDFTSLSWEKV